MAVAVGLAAGFSVDGASAQNVVCPGVTISGPAGVACGANTGALSAGAQNDQTESTIDNLRVKKLKALTQPASPMLTKAPPPSNAYGVETSVFGDGQFLYQNQSGSFNGADIGARSSTWTGLGGIDWTWSLANENYFTFGTFAGEDFTRMTMPLGTQIKTNSPMLGAYVMWFAGDSFSSELTYTHNWFNNSGLDCNSVGSTSECSQETVTSQDQVEGNAFYRFNPNAENGVWWWEPTAGFRYTHMTESLGIDNQTMTRLQGGVNFGTTFMWGGVKVEPKLSALVFSDVSVTGGTAPGGPAVATDEGQVWGKGVARLKFNWTKNFSTAIEGQVFGTGGTERIIEYQGLLELTYKWGGSDD